MPCPYSLDIRKKVMQRISEGVPANKVCKDFGISRSAVQSWKKLHKIKGSVEAKSNYQKGHSHKIKDLDEFKAFAQTNGGKTQEEMAKAWPGQDLSARTIGRALEKINYTRKKRLMDIKKEMKKKEQNT